MKNWTEGDILHIISSQDTAAVSRLCRVLVDQATTATFENKDGAKIKSMVESMKLGGYPTLTAKQASYAGGMLKLTRNNVLMHTLVGGLNRMEQNGNAPNFNSVVKRADEGIMEEEEVKAADFFGSHPKASVSVEVLPVDTSVINSDWGLF